VIAELDQLVIAALDAESAEPRPAAVAEPEPAPGAVERPPRPGMPGPRASDGTPYLDGIALAWRARRDLARQMHVPFDEPPPYYWD
jgi:hypothetical protein